MVRRMTAAALAVLALAASAAQEVSGTRIRVRISVENPPTHFQAQVARTFADRLAARLGDRISVEFYDGARLFRDTDVIGAVARGAVEIALPGIWQFDRMAPDTAALMLPSVYGLSVEQARRLADGPLGAALNAEIEAGIRGRVLGRWLDLGHAHLFSLDRRLRGIGDFRGRRVRVAGGRGNEERIRALGAVPVSIPSPDLDSYLRRRLVDGILTTYETVDSAGMDASGIAAVYEDAEYYPFYVPVASAAFWNGLDPELRREIEAAWEELLPAARETAVRAQEAAKARLTARGLRIRVPSKAEREAVREALLRSEDDMARRLGVSGEILALLRTETRRAGR